jgi:hypothetical protein
MGNTPARGRRVVGGHLLHPTRKEVTRATPYRGTGHPRTLNWFRKAQELRSVTGACVGFGISRKTCSKWRHRYAASGWDRLNLADRSRWAHRHPRQVGSRMARRLRRWQRWTGYGARRLAWHRRRKGVLHVPNRYGIHCVLQRAGLVTQHRPIRPRSQHLRGGRAEPPDRHRRVLLGPALPEFRRPREGPRPLQSGLHHRPASWGPRGADAPRAAPAVRTLPEAASALSLSAVPLRRGHPGDRACAKAGTGGHPLPMFDRMTFRETGTHAAAAIAPDRVAGSDNAVIDPSEGHWQPCAPAHASSGAAGPGSQARTAASRGAARHNRTGQPRPTRRAPS